MSGYAGRRVFRSSPGFLLLYVGITGLFAGGALMTYRARGWTWVSVGMLFATAVLGVGSIIESLVLRIELTDDAMVVTRLTGQTAYRIGDIERISEEKGGSPHLLMKDGKWVELPSVASNLGNSVRAWLKASGRA
jgi:hypothetical protein